MNIWIEVLGFLFLSFVFAVWLIWNWGSKKWLYYKYNKLDSHNDRSRIGEEQRRANLKSGVGIASVEKYGELEERIPIQTTSLDVVGENSNSNGKTSNRLRNFFKRT